METILAILVLLAAAVTIIVCVRKISALSANRLAMLEEKQTLENQISALNMQLKLQKDSFDTLEKQRVEAQNQLDKERIEAQKQLDAERLDAQKRRDQEREAAMAQLSKEREAAQLALSEERAAAQKQLEEEREASKKAIEEERAKLFDSQRKQMEESFKLLSEQNSAGLRSQNAESLTELLKPIKEKFSEFGQAVKDNQENAIKQDASMRQLIESMMTQSKTLGEEARNLSNALTGRSKVQGDFGEMLLVDLLKASGLEEGVHFDTQSVIRDANGYEIKSDSGATMIPDVIVYYPDDTEVIVDSKVSLSAYVSYCNAQTEEERSKFAKAHISSISKHIDEMKTKDYASYIEPGKKKIDYNIMFIPMEGAFRLMLEEAPTLWQTAKSSKVLIVSQMNLIIVLNMILMSWKQHDQEKNIEEVYKTTSELMSQLQNWMESYVKVGDYLDKAAGAYTDSKKKLSESNQSVIKKIDKLERLKLSPKRSNAKIKAGGRIVAGVESIIPKELSDGLEDEV